MKANRDGAVQKATQCGPSAPSVTIFRAAPYRSHLGDHLRILITICDQVHFCLNITLHPFRSPSGRFIYSQCLIVYICSLVFAIEFVFVLLECSIHHPPRPLYAKSGTFVLHELSWIITSKFCIFAQVSMYLLPGICNWICICISRAFQLHPPTWTALCQIWCLLSAVSKKWADNWWSTISIFVSE